MTKLMEGLPFAAPEAHASADLALMRACLRFAEYEFRNWYRYVSAPDHMADAQDNDPPDFRTLKWITETPAVTAAGWQAKALACTAWNRDMYDDRCEYRDTGTPLLAALLQDMVRPIRAEILARLAVEFGPLPPGYDEEGREI